eukprot:7390808-Prymnesium_polylepis.1
MRATLWGSGEFESRHRRTWMQAARVMPRRLTNSGATYDLEPRGVCSEKAKTGCGGGCGAAIRERPKSISAAEPSAMIMMFSSLICAWVCGECVSDRLSPAANTRGVGRGACTAPYTRLAPRVETKRRTSACVIPSLCISRTPEST